jgi:hypothetical protein
VLSDTFWSEVLYAKKAGVFVAEELAKLKTPLPFV